MIAILGDYFMPLASCQSTYGEVFVAEVEFNLLPESVLDFVFLKWRERGQSFHDKGFHLFRGA